MVQGRAEMTVDRDDGCWRRFANVLFLTLNWLHLGRPSVWPPAFFSRAALTVEQHAILQRLHLLVGEWRSFKDVTADSMGRTAGKIESLEGLVGQLEQTAARLLTGT